MPALFVFIRCIVIIYKKERAKTDKENSSNWI